MNLKVKLLPNLLLRPKMLELFWIATLFLSSAWFFRSSYRHGNSFGVWLDNEFLISPMFKSISNPPNFSSVNSYLPEYLGGLDIQGLQQFTPMYPLYFFGSSLFDSPEAAMYGLNFLIHLHLLIFVLGAYFLLRVLGIHQFAGALASILMVFNSNTLSYATWVNIVAPYAWFPWVLGAFYRALKRGSYGSWALFYLFCTLLIFASPSQPMIHAFFLVTIILFTEFVGSKNNSSTRASFFYSLKRLFLTMPIFIAIIAPVLVPAVVGINNQIRWIGAYPAVIGHTKIPFEAFLITQVELKELADLFFPPTAPREVGGLYLGVIVLALLIYGICFLRTLRIWRLFFFIGFYSLLSSFGDNFGLAYINYHTPIINLLREPSRFLVLVHLSFAICAALALNDIYSRFAKIFQGHLGVFTRKRLGQSKKVPTIIGAIIVLTFSIAQSNWINWKSPEISQSEYETGNWQDVEKVLERIKKLDPSNNFRVIFGGELNSQKASMFATFYGIRTLNTYINPLPYEQFNDVYFYNNLPPAYKELLGARYLICEKCKSEEMKNYSYYNEIWSLGSLKLFENEKAQNYLTAPRYVTFFPESVTSLREQLELNNFASESAFVPNNNLDSSETFGTKCEISRMSQHRFQKFIAVVDCETNGVMVLNSYNDGNWRAKINGKSTNILAVNGKLVGITLNRGLNNVQISHEPHLRNYLFRFGGFFIAIYVLMLVLIGFWEQILKLSLSSLSVIHKNSKKRLLR